MLVFHCFLGRIEAYGYNLGPSENVANNQMSEFISYEEKMYKCSICQYSSNDSQELLNHVTIHKGGKPYRCPLCPKTFRLKHHVQEHLRTHTGNKRYKCEICSNAYTKKMFLLKHYQKHHPEMTCLANQF